MAHEDRGAYDTIRVVFGGSMRLSDLSDREVINLCDCKKLGFVNDIVFDPCKGCVEAFVVPVQGKICFFGSDEEYVIPFECVKKIGEDIILVEIHEEKFLKSS